MYFLVLLRYLLSSDATDKRVATRIRLTSKHRLIALKAMNPWRRRCCPECGKQPIIWGKPHSICFCGCGHCGLNCRGRRMKDTIHNWNTQKNLYRYSEPLTEQKNKGDQP